MKINEQEEKMIQQFEKAFARQKIKDVLMVIALLSSIGLGVFLLFTLISYIPLFVYGFIFGG